MLSLLASAMAALVQYRLGWSPPAPPARAARRGASRGESMLFRVSSAGTYHSMAYTVDEFARTS
eukprot:6182737-Pleurochrysis_carterae.AAC.2